MNERGKTEPPLVSRDSVTRNVTARFVSPLPPASILATPNALKGRPSSIINTARPSSTSNNTDTTPSKQLLIAAPPHTARTPSAGGRPHNNATAVGSGGGGVPLLLSNQQQQQTTTTVDVDPYEDDDNLPDDCPPSRRMESAKRKIVQLSNTILAAELATEMRPELMTEIASKEIVQKLLRESNPHGQEIRELLESMAARGEKERFEVAFTGGETNMKKNDDEISFSTNNNTKKMALVHVKNNNSSDNRPETTVYDDDEEEEDEEQEAYNRLRDEVNEKSQKEKDIIQDRLSELTGAPIQTKIKSKQQQGGGSATGNSSRQLVPYATSTSARSTASSSGANASRRRRASSIASSLFSSGEDSFSDERNQQQQQHHQKRKTKKKFKTVNLEPDEELDVQSLIKEGKPMLIEASRGLSALQRAVSSVVEIFDAISSAQQRAFQHQVDKWYKTASTILPTVESTVSPNDFLQIRQFLVNTQKTATDSKEKLLGLSDKMFSKAREAASSIAIGVADSKDSILRMQNVVNDLKNELALASTLIPPSLYGKQNNNNNTNASASPSPARRNSPPNVSSSNEASNSSFSPQQSSANFDAAGSPDASAATFSTSVSARPQQHHHQHSLLPPPSLINPYAGTTFVCVSIENLINVVYPGCGKEYVISSSATGNNNNNKQSEMSMLFAKHGMMGGVDQNNDNNSSLSMMMNNSSSSDINNNPSNLHSFTSGKNALSLVRSLISNTVTPCNGHVIALRPFGPFLVAFDSVASAVTWSRGMQLYGSCIPWPEDLLSNPVFSVLPSKKTKIDPKDPTGLERAISTGSTSAAVLMDSQVAPPPVNQMSITEDIFFNAWRSMLSDGAVVNGPGGGLAHKISRLSLLQMREVFTSLQKGRLFERRGPQFKIGMSFESLTSMISSAKQIQNLQRGGGFRASVAAATSLSAIARGGKSVATFELANLFAESRNATSFNNNKNDDSKKSNNNKDSSKNKKNDSSSTNNADGKTENENNKKSNNNNTSASSSSSIAVQSEEEGLKLLIAPPSKEKIVDAIGVDWLPFSIVPERHRFTLRQSGVERIFEVDYAPPPVPTHLQTKDSLSQKATADENKKKTRQQLEAERRKKQRQQHSHHDGDDENFNHDEDNNNNNHNQDEDHHNDNESDSNLANTSRSLQIETPKHEPDDFFDPGAEDFDAMWFSRDDVTGGGGAAIVRPLQLSYLLPPQPVAPRLCSRECQSDPVTVTIHHNAAGSGGNGSRPSSRMGSPTTKILFSPDGTTRNLMTTTTEAYNPGDEEQDLEKVAAALEGAINNDDSGTASPARTATTTASPASTTRRQGRSAGGLSSTRGGRSSNRSGSKKRRRKKKEAPVEVEIKLPPVMVERAEQTMFDRNYALCPGGIGGNYFRDNDKETSKEALRRMVSGETDYADDQNNSSTNLNNNNNNNNMNRTSFEASNKLMSNSAMLSKQDEEILHAKLENNVELYMTSEGGGTNYHDSLNDDTAASVVDVCNLLEKLVLFLSGTSNFTDLLHGVSSFIGPLKNSSSSSVFSNNNSHQLEDDEDDEDKEGEQKPKHNNNSSWDRIADSLLSHLLARMTFPVPPSQSTTFRLVIGGIMACVAEFVRSIPDREANETKEKFKSVFYGGETISSLPTTTTEVTDEKDNNHTTATTVEEDEEDHHQQQQTPRRRIIDPSLRALSTIALIAQHIKIAPLDGADDAAAAAEHASNIHQKIRRRSKANEAVIEQQKNGATMNTRKTVASSMAATVKL